MAEEQAKKKRTKKPKVINCIGCNRPTKRLRRYYRNGKYFCSKRCWRTNKDKSKEPKGS